MKPLMIQPVNQAPVAVEVKLVAKDTFEVKLPEDVLTLQLHWTGHRGGWVRSLETGETQPFYMVQDQETLQLWLNGQIYRFQNPNIPSGRDGRSQAKGGILPADGAFKAPMPGTILKRLVNVGDSVAAGAPLILMESMKMEMTLAAPVDCTIKAIFCAEGELVEMQALLMTLEAQADA